MSCKEVYVYYVHIHGGMVSDKMNFIYFDHVDLFWGGGRGGGHVVSRGSITRDVIVLATSNYINIGNPLATFTEPTDE